MYKIKPIIYWIAVAIGCIILAGMLQSCATTEEIEAIDSETTAVVETTTEPTTTEPTTTAYEDPHQWITDAYGQCHYTGEVDYICHTWRCPHCGNYNDSYIPEYWFYDYVLDDDVQQWYSTTMPESDHACCTQCEKWELVYAFGATGGDAYLQRVDGSAQLDVEWEYLSDEEIQEFYGLNVWRD